MITLTEILIGFGIIIVLALIWYAISTSELSEHGGA